MTALRALYITDRWDGPYRYRCQQACEQLRADGAVADVMHLDSEDLPSALASYGVVVLFRLPYGERVEAVVQAARQLGLPLLFDIDDLLFDPRLDGLMPFRRRYTPEQWAITYGPQMVALRRTFDACDAFIGSTPELAEHARRLGKRAHVHPNVAPAAYLKTGKWAARLSRVLRVQPTIGYFSGSDTHDEDFESVAAAIESVLSEERNARLLIVGHFELGGRHPEIEQRLVRLPYMHWRDFALAYAACHVALAPLAVVNEFTSSKSALKFFEAGSFSTPVIATPVREMASAIEPGRTGWLARTRQDWTDAVLSALDPSVSERVGKAARAAVEDGHSAAAFRGKLAALLSEYAVTPKAPPRPPSLLEVSDEQGAASRIERALRPGRAARDIANIVLAARREVRPEVDVARLDALLDAISADPEGARPRISAIGGLLLTTGAADGFRGNDQVTRDGELAGENGSLGADPALTSPRLDIDSSRYRYLVVRLRTKAQSPSAKAQLYWRTGERKPFSERASTSFSVATDGLDRTYVVDLHRARTLAGEESRSTFRGAGTVTELRFDPLDRRGSFRVGPMVLLPGVLPPEDEAAATPRTAEPAREQLPLSDAGRDALHAKLAELSPSASFAFSIGGPPAAAREALARWIRDRPVEVERLFESREGNTSCVLRRRPEDHLPGVDIVVPVYNAKPLALACLESVARHARGDYRIVIVDDASTDDSLAPELARFAREHERTVLLTNAKNLGFVGTANRGMRHAGDRDVLLLNSDTVVSEGFLEGLRDAVYCRPRVGMCSPLSNNATICSVPEFCSDNPLPPGMTLDDMAALVQRVSRKLRPDLVTPHGFCLYLRADMLAETGLFDEEHFGKGFGEENDLGERAKAKGYRTVLADDVYVWHAGKASFGDAGRELERLNGEVLSGLHPDYLPAVATFVRTNPLALVHENVRRHLARRSMHVEPALLVVLHANPFAEDRGGVEHCVTDLLAAVRAPRVVLFYPNGATIEVAEIMEGDVARPLLYRFPLGSPPPRFCHDHPEALAAFTEVLSLFRVGWAHVHHLMFLPLTIADVLAKHGIPYVVTVHDFYPVCPSFNMLDVRTNTRCCPVASCDAERMRGCQRALFSKLGEPLPQDSLRFVAEHRRAFRTLFEGAARVLFPSPSAARHTSQAVDLDRVRVEVVPHGIDAPVAAAEIPRAGAPSSRRAALRVAIIGQIAYASKGADAYLELVSRLADADVEWHFFGRTDLFGFDRALDAASARSRVVRHGPYRREHLVASLRKAPIDVGLLLPIWPETYSYTLTELLAARVPLIARRIGALADRLDGAPHAILVDDVLGAEAVLRTLAGDPAALAKLTASMREAGTADLASPGVAEWAARHRALYDECATSAKTSGAVRATAAECARLNELAIGSDAPPPRAVAVTSPAPEIATSWWYRHAERAKPYVPESLRQITRRRLARDNSTTLVRFRLPGKTAVIGQQLTLDRRYFGTTQLTSQGNDPFILLKHAPLDPATVKLVRFNLWCSSPRSVFAQLYFLHDGRTTFDEENSITIPLNGALGQWQEYVANIEASDRARAWYEGGPIVALRFDPINVPGPIGLGELSLCDVQARPTVAP